MPCAGSNAFPPTSLSLRRRRDEARAGYDHRLRQLLIYHLTSSHLLPALSDLPSHPWAQDSAEDYLREDLETEGNPALLVGKVVAANPAPLSLEMLFNSYVCSLVNEFSALEALCPQGARCF